MRKLKFQVAKWHHETPQGLIDQMALVLHVGRLGMERLTPSSEVWGQGWEHKVSHSKALDTTGSPDVILASFCYCSLDKPTLSGSNHPQESWQWERVIATFLVPLLSVLLRAPACDVPWTQTERVRRSPGVRTLCGVWPSCQNSKYQGKKSSLVSMATCPPGPYSCSPSLAPWGEGCRWPEPVLCPRRLLPGSGLRHAVHSELELCLTRFP